jgi:hypothetical protein
VSAVLVGTSALYAGGQFLAYDGYGVNGLARLSLAGQFDGSFLSGSGFDSQVNAIAAISGGGWYIGGEFQFYDGHAAPYLVHLDPAGHIVTSFTLPSAITGAVRALWIDANTGYLYVGGDFPSHLLRLDASGHVDSSFATGGCDGSVRAFAPGPQASVYVGGSFTHCGGSSRQSIARFRSDGSIDAFASTQGFDNDVYALAAAPDGSGAVLAGGAFTTFAGQDASSIVRLTSAGTLDPSFSIGAGFDNLVFALSVATDGSQTVYVGGNFGAYQGRPVNNFVALDPYGRRLTYGPSAGFDGSVFIL